MNIYVDETFLQNKTVLSAVKISDKKIKEALLAIKRLHNWPMNKIIKATDIRQKSKKGDINSTVKAIKKEVNELNTRSLKQLNTQYRFLVNIWYF